MADSEKMPEQQQLKQKQHEAEVNNHVEGLNGDANLQSSDDTTPKQQSKLLIGKFIFIHFFLSISFVVVKCS